MSVEGYHCELLVAAPIEAVYDALTTSAGLAGWWATDVELTPKLGRYVRFRWSATSYLTLQQERLDSPSAVDWRCVEQHDENLPHPAEWLGTRMSFRLAAEGERTRLAFVHHGLTSALECRDVCADGWDFFLRVSLRQLLETGRGAPYRSDRPHRDASRHL